MKTKEEKEKLNRKYGNEVLNAQLSIIDVTKKSKEDTLKSLKTYGKQITYIDTDCVCYKI